MGMRKGAGECGAARSAHPCPNPGSAGMKNRGMESKGMESKGMERGRWAQDVMGTEAPELQVPQQSPQQRQQQSIPIPWKRSAERSWSVTAAHGRAPAGPRQLYLLLLFVVALAASAM